MTEYYIDPTATGSNDGLTKTNAWGSVQEMIDGTGGTTPGGGDTVLCRHSNSPDETLTAKIDVDNVNFYGDLTSGYARVIGVNSSWIEDGTRYEIDANSSVVNCMDFNLSTDAYILLKHFLFKNATGSGVNFNTAGTVCNVFINCAFRDNGAKGLYGYRNSKGLYIGCLFNGNGDEGGYTGGNCMVLFSCFRDNTEEGLLELFGGGLFFGNLVFDNGNQGIIADSDIAIVNNVLNGNGYSQLSLNDDRCVVFGNRLTNAPTSYYGLDANSNLFLSGYNYFEDNAAGNELDITLREYVNFTASTSTDDQDNGDINEGYTSKTDGAENFNLRSDASLRNQAIAIPLN